MGQLPLSKLTLISFPMTLLCIKWYSTIFLHNQKYCICTEMKYPTGKKKSRHQENVFIVAEI